MTDEERSPVVAAGVVCLRGDEVLLIRRGKPPRQGEWSLPGGRVEWGETASAAALRELVEETGVTADMLGLLDVIDGLSLSRAGEVERHYLLVDYAVRWIAGDPVAGDDADDARFWPADEAIAKVQWSETKRIIAMARDRFG